MLQRCSIYFEAIGYDIDLADYDMYECTRGHVFCEEHMKAMPADRKLVEASYIDTYKTK